MAGRLCINVNPDGNDSPFQVQSLGATAVRFPMKPWYPTREIVQKYAARNLVSILCSDSDTEQDGDHAAWAAEYRRRLDGLEDSVVIQAGNNEFEQVGPSSSTQAEADLYAELFLWKQAFWGFDFIGPGMTSGDPRRWSARCNALVDAIAVHPYVPSSGLLKDAIQRYRVWNKPIWVTEFPYYAREYGIEVLRWSDGPACIYNLRSWRDPSGVSWTDGIFNIDGSATWRVPSIATVNWASPSEGKMAFVVSAPMLEKMKAAGDAPKSDERYDGFNNSVCAGTKYLWTYDSKANITYKQPAWDLPL